MSPLLQQQGNTLNVIRSALYTLSHTLDIKLLPIIRFAGPEMLFQYALHEYINVNWRCRVHRSPMLDTNCSGDHRLQRISILTCISLILYNLNIRSLAVTVLYNESETYIFYNIVNILI